MPFPDPIIELCDGISLARIKNDLVLEEELYYLLMDLMRSPEMLKLITHSSISEFNQKVIDRTGNTIS